MALEDIKKLVEENKESEEFNSQFKTYIKDFVSSEILNSETVERYITETEDGKRLLQPKLDQYFNKGLKTWQEKTLPNMLEEEIKKRYPDETPENQKLREMEIKLQELENSRNYEAIKNKAITMANEKQLPLALAEFVITNDADKTADGIEKLSAAFKVAVEAAVKDKFKESGREIENSNSEPTSDISKMSMTEYMAYREKQGYGK